MNQLQIDGAALIEHRRDIASAVCVEFGLTYEQLKRKEVSFVNDLNSQPAVCDKENNSVAVVQLKSVRRKRNTERNINDCFAN